VTSLDHGLTSERRAGGVLTLHTRIDAETNIENWRRSLAGGRGRLSRSLLTSTWTVFFSYGAKATTFFAVLLIAEAKGQHYSRFARPFHPAEITDL